MGSFLGDGCEGRKTSKYYWNSLWERTPVPRELQPDSERLGDYVDVKFHRLFCDTFKSAFPSTFGRNLLEIGCGGSRWLPYFAKEFGFRIYGIDYSKIGCARALEIINRSNLSGKIIYSDFFNPPSFMLSFFDVVFSFGVVEHFEDTDFCVKQISRFLKKDGIMITVIPNLVGLNGLLQRLIDVENFNLHVVIDKDTLERSHQIAGLKVIFSDYFLPLNLCALNFEKYNGTVLYAFFTRLALLISKIVWFLDCKLIKLKSSSFFSPYIVCIGVKKE